MTGGAKALSLRYARALFGAAETLGVLPQTRADIENLRLLWHDHPELVAFLANPGLPDPKLKAILAAVGKRLNLTATSSNFLDLLLSKDRLVVLPEIADAFEALWRSHEGEIEVQVTSAVPVADDLRARIREHLHQKSGRKPLISWQTDPALLGGLVIHWSDRIFDGSLARKLDRLSSQMADAG